MCQCGHADDQHGLVSTPARARPMACHLCHCQQFKPGQVNLKEGEQIRHITED